MERSSCGYRIHRTGDELRFESSRGRAFWGWFVVLLVLGIVGMNALAQALLGNLQLAGVLGAIVFVLGLGAALVWRSRRSKSPASPVDYVLVLGLGELHNAQGERLAALSELRWDTRFDPFDSTRGFMYFLVMQWPGGSARVYKEGGCSGAQRSLQQVVEEIESHYLQGQPPGPQAAKARA